MFILNVSQDYIGNIDFFIIFIFQLVTDILFTIQKKKTSSYYFAAAIMSFTVIYRNGLKLFVVFEFCCQTITFLWNVMCQRELKVYH